MQVVKRLATPISEKVSDPPPFAQRRGRKDEPDPSRPSWFMGLVLSYQPICDRSIDGSIFMQSPDPALENRGAWRRHALSDDPLYLIVRQPGAVIALKPDTFKCGLDDFSDML